MEMEPDTLLHQQGPCPCTRPMAGEEVEQKYDSSGLVLTIEDVAPPVSPAHDDDSSAKSGYSPHSC